MFIQLCNLETMTSGIQTCHWIPNFLFAAVALALVGETALPRHVTLPAVERCVFSGKSLSPPMSSTPSATRWREPIRSLRGASSKCAAWRWWTSSNRRSCSWWWSAKWITTGTSSNRYGGDKGLENDRRFVAAGRLCLLENKNIARDTGPSSHFW